MSSKSFKTEECIPRLFCRAVLLFLLPVLALRCADAHRPINTWISPVRINSFTGILEYAEDSSIRSMTEFDPPSINLNPNRKLWASNEKNGDGELSSLTLQFSLWYPALHGKVTEADERNEYFLLSVLAVLRDFFCQHISHITIINPSNYSQSLCLSVGNVTEDLGRNGDVNETMEASTEFDILLNFGAMVISEQREGNIDWMSWEVTYEVVETGRLATPMKIHEDFTLQSTLQSVLERAIQRGTLNKGLRDYLNSTRPTFSIIGQEVETFQESAMALLEQYDFSSDAFLLQQIGIAIVILVICVYVMLTGAARNHRLLRERRKILEAQRRHHYREEVRRSSLRKSVGHPAILQDAVLLETEEDVNLMLAVGREESLKAWKLSGALHGSGQARQS